MHIKISIEKCGIEYLSCQRSASHVCIDWVYLMKKQKNDIHVLNWGRIVENCWTEQVNLNGVWAKNKGIQFESVIEKLLLSMFPEEVWKRTKESHDGKRDFVYPADTFLKEQKWAECKNYTSNLSINIISPTLIMGAIDNIKSIYSTERHSNRKSLVFFGNGKIRHSSI